MQNRLFLFGLLVVAWTGLLVFGGTVARITHEALNPTQSFAGAQPILSNDQDIEGGVVAFVYSRYPLSAKDELIINKGRDVGIQSRNPVLFDDFFVGEVVDVYDHAARIYTIFDSRLRLPVRVGENQINAVLEGGINPKITLISEEVSSGDEVYLASENAPYGLFVGVIGEISLSQDELLRRAGLRVEYNPAELREVVILESPIKKEGNE